MKIKAWIQAARPRTLPLSLSGILVGISLVDKPLHWSVVLCFTTTVFFQILSNFANDLGDGIKGTDNDQRIGPRRAIQSGNITIASMKRAVVLFSFISFISGTWLILSSPMLKSAGGIVFYGLLAGTCILAAITYTVGKRSYGYFGLGDLMVFIFFGWVAVLGSRHLYHNELHWSEILGAISIGSWSTMVLNLNNLRDESNDRNSSKKTLVILLGPSKARTYHYFLAITGSLCWIILLLAKGIIEPKWYLGVLTLIPFALHLNVFRKIKDPIEYDPQLKRVALATFFASLTMFTLSFF